MRNEVPKSLQEFAVRAGLAAAASMEDLPTEDSVVGSVNPIGNARALTRVSGPTAVAIKTVPISMYAMVARFFCRRILCCQTRHSTG